MKLSHIFRSITLILALTEVIFIAVNWNNLTNRILFQSQLLMVSFFFTGAIGYLLERKTRNWGYVALAVAILNAILALLGYLKHH